MQVRDYDDDLKEQWNSFVDLHPVGWFWHRAEWLAYLLARCEGQVDRSFALRDDEGRIVAICPLILEDGEFQAQGDPLPVALSRLVTDATEVGYELRRRADRDKVSRVRDYLPAMSYIGQGQDARRGWPALLNTPGWKDVTWSSRVIDLAFHEDVLWRGLTAGHRSDVKSQLKRFTIAPCPVWDASILHGRVHGRARAPRTWQWMADWVQGGFAQCWGAWWQDELVAYVYVICYKNKAYYASGAKLAGGGHHALLWTAIQELRLDGYDALELGWQGYATDVAGQKKEAFKRHFGGLDVPVYAWEWRRDG